MGFFRFFSEPQARVFFRTHLLIFGEPPVKCSRIPEPYPQRLSLKILKKKKITQLVPDITQQLS
jgi:hypothetical protein